MSGNLDKTPGASWEKMIGELLREAGVLILVFEGLHGFLYSNDKPDISPAWVVGASLAVIVAGGIMERVRVR